MQPTLEDVTVVVVAYNSARVLRQSLPRLRSAPHVIVVDNASDDGSADCVRELAPHAQLLVGERNVGFGRANNRALAQVRTPFALLLNPDCLFEVAALERLLAAVERYPDAAMLAPKLYQPSGKPETCYKAAYWRHDPDLPYVDPAGDLCSDYLSGAALLLRMEPMGRVGFFDPWFFIYYEDDDLCLRARRAGLALVLVADARLTHFVGASSRPTWRQRFRIDYHKALSRVYVDRKYLGAGIALGGAARLLFESLLKLPAFLLIANRRMVVRSLARIAAVLAAPMRLRAPHAERAAPAP